jgi:hypothetical protein
LTRWSDTSEKIKQTNCLVKETKDLSDSITNLLRTCDNIQDFKKTIDAKLSEKESYLKKKIDEKYPLDDKIIEDLIFKFNGNKILMNNNYVTEMSKVLLFKETRDFILNPNYTFNNQEFKHWIQPHSNYKKFIKTFTNTPEKVIEWIKIRVNAIYSEIFKCVGDRYYIEDTKLRSILHILNQHLFNKSLLEENKGYFNITTVINDIILIILRMIYNNLQVNRNNS